MDGAGNPAAPAPAKRVQPLRQAAGTPRSDPPQKAAAAGGRAAESRRPEQVIPLDEEDFREF